MSRITKFSGLEMIEDNDIYFNKSNKLKKLAKEHICLVHGHGQQCGNSQREGDRGWTQVEKVGENGNICNSVNNNNNKQWKMTISL